VTKMDTKMMGAGLVVLSVLLAGVWVGKGQMEGNQYTLWKILSGLDSAVATLRKGGAESISSVYSLYKDNLPGYSENSALDNNFKQLAQLPSENVKEENIFALRADIVSAAANSGVSVSPIYTYSLFIILAISALVSFIVTLLTKRMVNWELVRHAKSEVSKYMKEHRAAALKRDTKTLNKLEQRKAEINKLQGTMFSQNFKPTIISTVPLLLLWYIIGAMFSGWVVAWLPLRVDLPVFGPLVAFGFGWWWFLTYLGFSQVFRKILIRENVHMASPAAPAPAKVLPK